MLFEQIIPGRFTPGGIRTYAPQAPGLPALDRYSFDR